MYAIILLLLFVNSINTASSLGFENGSYNEVTYCINKERQALLGFKVGLIDDGGRLSSWSSEEVNKDCCNWSGVKCSNQTGHVIKLDLRSFILRGNISPSLLELWELNYLDLSGNDFEHKYIPKFFGSFTKLQHLDLSFCQFGGTIPSQLGNLSNLNYLDFSSNDFEHRPIPKFFGSFTKLQYLDLSYSHFDGTIPSQLGNLSNLNYLDLSYNDFEHRPIPEFFGSFTKLQHLDLSSSHFDGTIPSQLENLSNLNTLVLSNDDGRNFSVENLDWLSHLSSLKYLEMDRVDLSRETNWVGVIKSHPSLSYVTLGGCQLSKVVSPSLSLINSSTSIKTLDLSFNGFTSSMYYWLFNLSNSLIHLSLQHNMLKGPIPESFGNYMPSLESLDLSSNLLEGMIPKSFRNLCNLQYLVLEDNSLSGDLSDFVDNLSGCPEATLESLFVDGNKLFGPLPHGIINFSSLKHLFLSRNKLNETLTINLGTLSKLEVLDLSFNSLSGVVTEAHLASLSHLTALGLSFTQLDFKISPQWIPPFQLEFISLKSCNLGPSFPQWIRTQKHFNYLDISNSGISENIPTWFWDLTGRCTYLNLSSNNIGGTIPNLSSIFVMHPVIDLGSNNFEGSIPLFPSSLTSLNLSRNKFSGTLSFLCQLSKAALYFLDVSHNFLTEGIPDCLGKLQEVVVLNLAHNKLWGKIPASMGTLYNLETLNFYNNSFSGELPLSLSNCTGLRFLDVGVNKLSGNVPTWLGGNISDLYILSLRSNDFFGTIPSNLCWLKALQVLDLSMNNLFGTIPPCLNNLNAMVQKGLKIINHEHEITYLRDGLPMTFDYSASYTDRLVIGWQGRELEFGKNLRLLKSIDLSSNNLIGEIPREITELYELVTLNLSRNALHGKVPQQIGRLNSLLSLDLSRNELSGNIPASLSRLNFLNYLDLSYNNFSGKIPSGTQLQAFNASNYIGNVRLCGPPLPSNCRGHEPPPTMVKNEEDNNEYKKWLYIGIGVGFVAGFWGT